MVLERSVGQHARTEQISEQTRALLTGFEIFTRLRSSARQYDSPSGTGQEEGGFPVDKTRYPRGALLAVEALEGATDPRSDGAAMGF